MASALEVFASGIRNSVGFDWHPVTKELWFTDNGVDHMGDDFQLYDSCCPLCNGLVELTQQPTGSMSHFPERFVLPLGHECNDFQSE
jgi:hypothetical protein